MGHGTMYDSKVMREHSCLSGVLFEALREGFPGKLVTAMECGRSHDLLHSGFLTDWDPGQG